jgi:hypothetical protein
VVTEQLEDRTLLSVTSLWLDGELSVQSDSNDSITIETNGALEVVVKVNSIEGTDSLGSNLTSEIDEAFQLSSSILDLLDQV